MPIKRMPIFLIITIIVVTAQLFAYEEWSLPQIDAPTVLKPFAVEAQIRHQFFGRIIDKDPFTRLFGVSEGADVSIGARMMVWRSAQAYVSYDNMQLYSESHNEFTAGASYAIPIPLLFLNLQADGELFSYASYRSFPEKRTTGYFLDAVLRNDPFLNRFVFLYTFGYDFDTKIPGMGVGAEVSVTENVHIFGSFFPVLDGSFAADAGAAAFNPYSFGIKFTTFGHQFFLFAGNATEIGPRHLMRGAPDNHLRLGFMIKRLFDISGNAL